MDHQPRGLIERQPAPLLRAETFYRYQIMLRTRAMSKLSQTLAKIVGTLALPDRRDAVGGY